MFISSGLFVTGGYVDGGLPIVEGLLNLPIHYLLPEWRALVAIAGRPYTTTEPLLVTIFAAQDGAKPGDKDERFDGSAVISVAGDPRLDEHGKPYFWASLRGFGPLNSYSLH